MKLTTRTLSSAFSLLLLSAVAVAAADESSPADRRADIDQMAEQTVQRLFAEEPGAEALYDRSAGYAVFSNYKFQLVVAGGGGQGVAVDRESGDRTYMKMGTGGVGLGIGGKKSSVVFLFETDAALDRFIDSGWVADTQAGAAAGKASADVESTFHDGVKIYQMTDKGLIASADVSGAKYWKHDELNQ